MVNYRYYQGGDEQQIVELWNRCLLKDPITTERFRNLILLDANFDPKGLRLAFQGNHLIGCVYAVRRQLPMVGTELDSDDGWITFFFIHQEFQRRGIGEKLMEEAIQFLKKNGRKRLSFSSYAPNYIVPGIDSKTYPQGYKFLKSQGFVKLYSPVAMDRNLVDFYVAEDIEQLIEQRQDEGYSFRLAQHKDLYELVQFANVIFNPDWGRAIREGILQGLSLDRILVTRKEDRIVGFCIYGGYEGVPERFGPFGVDPNEQGKGLGKILLNICLKQMKAEGLHSAWFLWTGDETPAGYLYKSTGFEITRKFHVMQKEIE